MRHRRNADVESQQGVTNIELNTAHRGSIVSPEQLRPPQHGDFHLPEHPTDESIGQDSKRNDSLERIVGPNVGDFSGACLLYTSPSPRDVEESRMPSSA